MKQELPTYETLYRLIILKQEELTSLQRKIGVEICDARLKLNTIRRRNRFIQNEDSYLTLRVEEKLQVEEVVKLESIATNYFKEWNFLSRKTHSMRTNEKDGKIKWNENCSQKCFDKIKPYLE